MSPPEDNPAECTPEDWQAVIAEITRLTAEVELAKADYHTLWQEGQRKNALLREAGNIISNRHGDYCPDCPSWGCVECKEVASATAARIRKEVEDE